MSWMGNSFNLNKITNPYFIYWSFTMKVCVCMTNVVVERTFKMHIADFKKRCNTWIAEIHFNIDITHSLFNTLTIFVQAHLRQFSVPCCVVK